jgi:transposase-like protein
MQLPDIVVKVAILAAVQERLLEKFRKGVPKSGVYGKTVIQYDKADNKSFAPSEMWKARQLKEYRRTNGFFYKCGEKFIP